MKISELIEQLNYVLEKVGDIPVVVFSRWEDGEYVNSVGVLVSFSADNPEDKQIEIWGSK